LPNVLTTFSGGQLAMGRFRTTIVALAGALSLVVGGAAVASADEGGTLLSFHSMTTVTGAAVGAVNDRGITGGGKPWQITAGSGELDRNGHLHVSVTGLVIPVAPFNGTNPLGQFAAIVSCETPHHGIVNILTAPVATSSVGNATIDTTVSLPHPCIRPIVFVTSAGGSWFAMSNRDEEDED
jgi:hypothetical protein